MLATIAPAGVLAVGPVTDPATGTTAWEVTTTPASTNTVPHDGTGGVAEFTYDYLSPGYVPGSNNGNGNGSGVPTQTWRFSSTATIAGPITLPWRLHGLHAWAGVTVDLRAYIKRGGIDVQNTDLLLPAPGGPGQLLHDAVERLRLFGHDEPDPPGRRRVRLHRLRRQRRLELVPPGRPPGRPRRRPERQLRGSGRRPLGPAGVSVPRPESRR